MHIPTVVGHPFRFISDSHSNSKRTPVPIDIGQSFRFDIGHFFGESERCPISSEGCPTCLGTVAAHALSHQAGRATTLEEHRPKSHQKHLQWTPSRLIDWAAKAGPNSAQVVEEILRRQPHPEMGYRSCRGIINLGKGAGLERLEAACKRALHFHACSYRSVKSILQNHLENQPLEEQLHLLSPPHENLRGGAYYDQSSNPSIPVNPSTDP